MCKSPAAPCSKFLSTKIREEVENGGGGGGGGCIYPRRRGWGRQGGVQADRRKEVTNVKKLIGQTCCILSFYKMFDTVFCFVFLPSVLLITYKDSFI